MQLLKWRTVGPQAGSLSVVSAAGPCARGPPTQLWSGTTSRPPPSLAWSSEDATPRFRDAQEAWQGRTPRRGSFGFFHQALYQGQFKKSAWAEEAFTNMSKLPV